MFKKYLSNSQSGAALLLVLFLVLFLSISGAVLLSSTTYSKKSIINYEEEMNEFYRLEGALDLMINLMDNFTYHTGNYLVYSDGTDVLDEDGNQIEIIEYGPYYYIERGEAREKEYNIGDKIIVVSIEPEVLVPKSIEGENKKKYEYKLVSMLREDPEIKREITMSATAENKTGVISVTLGESEGMPKSSFPGNPGEKIIYISSKDVHHKQTKWIKATSPADSGVTFDSFFNYYGLDATRVQNAKDWDGKSQLNDEQIRYFNKIKASGNNIKIAIPKGHLTYANKVEISGCGNSSVHISGVLIAKTVEISGNCNYHLDGGIIAENFILKGNSAEIIINKDSGFDNEGGAGDYQPQPSIPIYGDFFPSDYNWVSSKDILDLETNRIN